LDNPWLSADAFDSMPELMPEVRQIETAQVTPLDPFQLLANTLIGIQFRGIRGQALEMESLGRAVGQELFDDMAAVNRRAIPDDYQAAGDLTQQVLQKGDHLL
jgi:hypothetical protein